MDSNKRSFNLWAFAPHRVICVKSFNSCKFACSYFLSVLFIMNYFEFYGIDESFTPDACLT